MLTVDTEDACALQRERLGHALCDALDSDNALTRCLALKALQKLDSHNAITGKKIVALLLDPDPDVRVDTATALGNLKFTDAVAPLLKNIEGDPEGEVRIQATIALGKIGSTASLEPLTRCIRKEGYPELDFPLDDSGFSSCWEVQRHALEALGKINCPKASQDLQEILRGEKYDYLRGDGYRVLLALDSHGSMQFLLEQYVNGDLHTRIDAMRALGSSAGIDPGQRQELRKILFTALADDDSRLRREAVITTARHFATDSGMARALPVLLNDPDDEVRQCVLEKLAEFNSATLREKLHELTGQTRPPRLTALIRLLGKLAHESSAEIICKFLGHEDEAVRYAVLEALTNIAVPVATGKLLQIVAGAEQADLLRLHAIRALAASFHLLDKALEKTEKEAEAEAGAGAGAGEGEGGEQLPLAEQLIKVLEAAVNDESECVSFTALSALTDLEPARAEDILLQHLKTGASEPAPANSRPMTDLAAPQDDATSGNTISLAALMPQLPDEGKAESSTLAAIFHKAEQSAPQPSSGEPLEQTSEAEIRPAPEHVELLAIRLLGGLSACSEEVITRLLTAGAEDHLRAEVIRTIGRLGDVRGLPLIVQTLESGQREERVLALDAMRSISRLQDALATLSRLAADEDPVIREKTLLLLASIEGRAATLMIAKGLQDTDIHVCKAALRVLNPGNSGTDTAAVLLELMFRHGGDLRVDVGAALRRLGEHATAERLMDILCDASADDRHWICIDALAEMFADKK